MYLDKSSILKEQIIYLKGLNGIRAIAALAVVVSHISILSNQFGIKPIFGGTHSWMLGGYGVTMFFSLSGFLITFLLIKEKEKTNKIEIKKFYWRRLLRIWPLYYSFILVTLSIQYLFGDFINFNYLPYYLLFMANYSLFIAQTIPMVGHFWSVSCEEQFYLVWPWFMKNVTIRKTLILLCFILLLKLIFYYVEYKYNYPYLYEFINIFKFHHMIIGALGGQLYLKYTDLAVKISSNITVQIIILIIFMFICFNNFHIISLIDGEFICVITVLIIISQISNTFKIINLEKSVLIFLGKISYGIYVLHIIVLYLYAKLVLIIPISNFPKTILAYSGTILLTILASYISYNYFEIYFLKLKDKFSIVLSSQEKI